MLRYIQFVTLICYLLVQLGCQEETAVEPEPVLIPEPMEWKLEEGRFTIDKKSTIHYTPELKDPANYLRSFIQKATGWALKATDSSGADIRFVLDSSIDKEAYQLVINDKVITVRAAGSPGAFYAVQTIRQLFPSGIEAGMENLIKDNEQLSLPQLTIKDKPAFPYRGMHLDVGRHFFPPAFIKKYISWLAMLKMNRFHWHLTEDQGWRIEIEKYPRLSTHAAWRDSTLLEHYNDYPKKYKKERYGGFYSKDEIRDIVTYADSLHVTIVPEIEMPGHAQAAISAYPELGCTGEQVPVASSWGIFEQVYCPNEQTLTFLKDVLDEVMELFPGEYIHIGGDEAPKTNWKQCDHCQQIIAKYGLKDEEGLQSWFIKQIETHVNSRGRKIIGWDEILEGGLAPNATVMSWRGIEGGIKAAKSGHDVIMTPTSHAYFDYYQSDHPDEPLAIGGFLPLKKVYGFNPVPEVLSQEEAKHILGGQGNIWTEYIPTTRQVEYMAFPRMLAMAEVLWHGPARHPDSGFGGFARRVSRFETRLDQMDIHANTTALYQVESKVIKSEDDLQLQLSTFLPDVPIRFSVNGGPEQLYIAPIKLDSIMVVRSQVVKNGEQKGRITTDSMVVHKGVRAAISLNSQPHPAYNAGGTGALNNGRFGSSNRFGDSEWLGFWGDDLEIVISFDDPVSAFSVQTRFFHAPGQWVYTPEKAILNAELSDGSVYNLTAFPSPNRNGPVHCDFDLSPLRSKFNGSVLIEKLTINIPNYGLIPKERQGAGQKAWTFVDEIVIDP